MKDHAKEGLIMMGIFLDISAASVTAVAEIGLFAVAAISAILTWRNVEVAAKLAPTF